MVKLQLFLEGAIFTPIFKILVRALMGGATTSTSGVGSPKGLSFLRGSRCSKGKVFLWSLLRFCLLLAKLSLRLFGRRRRRVRSRLIRDRICYKSLLIFSHVIFIDSSNLPVKEKVGRKRGDGAFSLFPLSTSSWAPNQWPPHVSVVVNRESGLLLWTWRP